MKEEFVNNIMVHAAGFIPQNRMEEFRNELAAIVQDYDVKLATKDLTVWSYELPKCFEYFIVTKHIEGKSDETLKLYRRYLTDALMKIGKPVEDITQNDIRVYLYMVQKERGISNRSLDSRRSCLQSFFSWIAAEGYIPKNPMLTIKPIKYERKERTPLEPINLERVREACQTVRERALVEVFYSTACRVTELVRLDLSDVDLGTGEVRLFGKGDKHRTSYLSPRARVYLKAYLDERDDSCPALFVGDRKPHDRLKKGAVEKIIRNIGARCGIDHLHPHLFRHTLATDALAKGMPVTQLKSLLGHSSLDTTMIYAKVAENEVAASHCRYIS